MTKINTRFGHQGRGAARFAARLTAFGLIAALAACSATDEVFHLETVEIYDGVEATEEGVVQASLRGVSVDAKQRFVWSPTIPSRDVVREGPDGIEEYGVRPRTVVCAEPSPDAVSALTARLSGSASLSQGASGQNAGEARAAFERSVAEAVSNIGERTQVIQLMRDTLYRACEAYGNGALDTFGYALILGQIDILMVQILGIDTLGRADQNIAALSTARLHLSEAVQTEREKQVEIANAEAELALAERTLETLGPEAPERSAIEGARDRLIDDIARLNSELPALTQARQEREIAVSNLSGAPVSAANAKGIEGIVDGTTEPGKASGSRASNAACLVWFARHPEVAAEVHLDQHTGKQYFSLSSSDSRPIPAIAMICGQMLASQLFHTNFHGSPIEHYADFAGDRAKLRLQAEAQRMGLR